VTHAGDVAPGVARLVVEELGLDRLDGLADLDGLDADSIEDEAVAEPTAGTWLRMASASTRPVNVPDLVAGRARTLRAACLA